MLRLVLALLACSCTSVVHAQGRVAVHDVAFSPDGNLLASAYDNGLVVLWDAAANEQRYQLKTYRPSARAVAISERLLVAGCNDGRILRWALDVNGPRPLTSMRHPGIVKDLLFSPDGRTLISTSTVGSIRIWDAEERILRHSFLAHRGAIGGLAIAPAQNWLASAGIDGKVRIWDMTNWKLVQTLDAPEHVGVWRVAFSLDGRLLAGGGGDSSVRVWDTTSGKLLHELPGHGNMIFALDVSPSGTELATGSGTPATDAAGRRYGVISLWNIQTGEQTGEIRVHSLRVSALAYSPKSNGLISASQDGTLQLLTEQPTQ